MNINNAMQTARLAAEAGAAAAMQYFRKDIHVEMKPDETPVTIADHASETAILEVLRGAYPDCAILTEESGALGSGATRWIVDPLDGTKGFARGGIFWGPLVALEHEGQIIAGAMVIPALQQSYYAGKGLGAYRNDERLHVSTISNWKEATLSLGELNRLLKEDTKNSIAALATTCRVSRCYGDVASCAMLLDGRAEAWIEMGVHIWDLSPAKILVEEAGGVFTDFNGQATHTSGNAIATNGKLHTHVLKTITASAK